MNIKTHYEPNAPHPLRWSAIDDDTYEGGGLIGYGATEAEAIQDLKDQTEDGAVDSAGDGR